MSDPHRIPRRIALTGSIGSGKTTVGGLLAALGAVVLDADQVVHDLYRSDAALIEAVTRRFGPEASGPLGVDRAVLGPLVFSDRQARRDLEEMVHPLVRERMAGLEADAAAKGARLIVQDIPLLFENGLDAGFDGTLLVEAPESLAIDRIVARDGISRHEALRRLHAQMPADDKRRRATWLIENDGSLADLADKVEALYPAIAGDI